MKCINNCRHCRDYKCRCDSCFAVSEQNGKWYCKEYEDYCESINECDEFIERNEDFLDVVKSWAIADLGIEEYSDEWYQLMDI